MFNLTTVPANDPNRITLHRPPADPVVLLPAFDELVSERARLWQHPTKGARLKFDLVLEKGGFGHLSVSDEETVFEDLYLRRAITHTYMHAMGYVPKKPPEFQSISEQLSNVTIKKRVSKNRR